MGYKKPLTWWAPDQGPRLVDSWWSASPSSPGRFRGAMENPATELRRAALRQTCPESRGRSVVIDEDDLHRDLAEIDENLCRAELSQGERAKHTARRKEIFEEMHPETKHGAAPAKRNGKGGKEGKDPDSGSLGFIDATAKATGKGRTTISLDAERGEKINGNALDALSGTPLDKGSRSKLR